MPEGFLGRDFCKFFRRSVSEWSSRCSQNDGIQGILRLAHQALKDGVVLTVRGNNASPVFFSRSGYDFSADHQGLLVGQDHVLAGLEGGEGRAQAGRSNHCHDDEIGIG